MNTNRIVAHASGRTLELHQHEIDRFWSKVAKTENTEFCWIWGASTLRCGYGRIKLQRLFFLAHRVSWQLSNEPIEGSLIVCHKCDVRQCVNPSHLFLGTQAENVRDMEFKGRAIHPTGYERSHKLSKSQAEEIRTIYAEGKVSFANLAIHFGVSRWQISNIVKFKSFRVSVGDVREQTR